MLSFPSKKLALGSRLLFSAVICTFNRDFYIEQALKSLIDQSLEKEEYEILLVDNNSTDKTKDIVNDLNKKHNNVIRYIFEGNQGLSYARNKAIKESKGKYICFLDDDAIASKDWLKEVLDAFNYGKNVGVVGGKVDLIWEKPKPDWAIGEIATITFAHLDFSDEMSKMIPPRGPVGANASYLKSAFLDKNISFPTNLGRVGKKLLSGEESKVLMDFDEYGYEVVYNPKANVQHIAPANRINMNYVKERFYWEGRSRVIRWYKGTDTVLNRMKFVKEYLRKTVSFYLRRYKNLSKNEKKIWNSYWKGFFIQMFNLVMKGPLKG